MLGALIAVGAFGLVVGVIGLYFHHDTVRCRLSHQAFIKVEGVGLTGVRTVCTKCDKVLDVDTD